MSGRQRSPFTGGQIQLAKRYEELLETIHAELPEPFKSREAIGRVTDDGTGELLKTKNAGLVENEHADGDEPKDWFLTQSTKRWLEAR
jgi:hypothetical protein